MPVHSLQANHYGMNNAISIETTITAPIEKVWQYWNDPAHITQWNAASTDWHTPRAENDLKQGGSFLHRMEAKDGSMGFDFGGVYDEVEPNCRLNYTIGDGRKVQVQFASENAGTTTVKESFEPEGMNPPEMQRTGWQAILDNFKRYVEAAE